MKIRSKKLVAKFISLAIPSKYWFSATYHLTYVFKFYHRLFHRKNDSLRFNRAYHLNNFLNYLSQQNKQFPIPYSIQGLELLQANCGIMLCSTHLPLNKLVMTGIIANDFMLNGVIASKPNGQKEQLSMPVWGTKISLPVIVADSQALVKTRSLLSKKGNVILLIDNWETGTLSPNSLRICGKTDSKAIFFSTEMDEKGHIGIKLFSPPNPFCKSETEIQENLNFLKLKMTELLDNYQLKRNEE